MVGLPLSRLTPAPAALRQAEAYLNTSMEPWDRPWTQPPAMLQLQTKAFTSKKWEWGDCVCPTRRRTRRGPERFRTRRFNADWLSTSQEERDTFDTLCSKFKPSSQGATLPVDAFAALDGTGSSTYRQQRALQPAASTACDARAWRVHWTRLEVFQGPIRVLLRLLIEDILAHIGTDATARALASQDQAKLTQGLHLYLPARSNDVLLRRLLRRSSAPSCACSRRSSRATRRTTSA